MNKGIIILGSSRSHGDTAKVIAFLKDRIEFDVIDLSKKKINHYDYDFKNEEDDFSELFKNMVQNYQTIVFATPIYWYTMSGITKVFLDRISDFLKKEKEYGRMLRGKNMAVVSCSNHNDRDESFTMPFVRSAAYLGMEYVGDVHTWVEVSGIPDEVKDKIKRFAQLINLL